MIIDLRISELTQTQRNALQTAAPIIKEYLRRIITVYRRCNPEQRAILLEHNTILREIIEGIGRLDGE